MMELFWLYVITRLSGFKEALSDVSLLSGAMLAACIFFYFVAKLRTCDTERKIFITAGILNQCRKGLWILVPLFFLSSSLNMLLPSTRDGIMVAGAYGVTEAVKNERVQQVFSKSAKVASQWLDAQLNPPDDKGKEPAVLKRSR